MAEIDKIYGTKEQHREFAMWVMENKPELLEYFYPQPKGDDIDPITNFPVWADRFLWDSCPIPWVIERLYNQYGGCAPR